MTMDQPVSTQTECSLLRRHGIACKYFVRFEKSNFVEVVIFTNSAIYLFRPQGWLSNFGNTVAVWGLYLKFEDETTKTGFLRELAYSIMLFQQKKTTVPW